MTYNQIEENIRRWAGHQEAVRALVVIGSRARSDHAADDWSDLDIIMFVSDPTDFARSEAWLDNFGPVVLKYPQITGSGHPEWIVLYDGALKIDFLLAPDDGSLAEGFSKSPFDAVSRRGLRILIDKGNGEPVQAGSASAAGTKPETAEFTYAVNQFWITAYRAATMIGRGDLWRARKIMDTNLRELVIQMMAWHAQTTGGDTWYDGRFIYEWADPRALASLPELFAPFEPEASAAALRGMVDLYGWLTEETAVHQYHPYPAAALDTVRDWIEAALKVID